MSTVNRKTVKAVFAVHVCDGFTSLCMIRVTWEIERDWEKVGHCI